MKISKSYKEQVNKEFSELSTNQEKWDYLRNLISKNYFNYQDLSSVLFLSTSKTIKIFEVLDIKICSNKNCISKNGRLQSRENFRRNSKQIDNLDNYCKNCQSELKRKRLAKNKMYNSTNLNNQIFYKKCANPYCNYFNIDLPVENFHKNSLNKDGIDNFCKECKSKIARIRNQKRKFEEKISVNYKICANLNCNYSGIEQPIENFYYNSMKKDGFEDYCKECSVERIKNQQKVKTKVVNYKVCANKNCSYGNKPQPVSNFSQDSSSTDNLESYCKICKNAYKKRLASYSTFNDKLSNFDETRKDPSNDKLLQVKCVNCGNWFNPNVLQVECRISALKGIVGNGGSENHFYCSDFCKNSCPVYRQRTRRKNENLDDINREVQPELRELVFERDNYSCIKCGSINNLNCHHVEGIQWEPIESADIDKCITVCEDCHKEIHNIPGCTYQDMQCN